jgi:hypothetical protein
MRRLWLNLSELWDRAFFTEKDLSVVGPFRIGYALLLLINVLVWRPDLDRWFGHQGVVTLEAGLALSSRDSWTIFAWLPPEPELLTLCHTIFLVQIVCLMVGLLTRFQSICVFLWFVSFQNRTVIIFDGEDNLFRLFAFYLIFLPAGRYLAVDQKIFRRAEPGPLPVWPLRLVQIQMTLVYLSAAVEKVRGPDWRAGTAWYYVSRLDDLFGKFYLPEFLFQSLAFSALLSWAVVVVELMIPLGLWFRATRPATVLLAIFLHLAMEYSMFLFLFQWLMILGLLSFVEPSEWKFLFRKAPDGRRKACPPS